MEIYSPVFSGNTAIGGLYKITFNNKWFYIGSSKDLKRRFIRWKCVLKQTKHLKNKNIRLILPEVIDVRFDILCEISNTKVLFDLETKEIKNNWENEFLLNRCPNAATPAGMRHYNGYIPPPPIRKGIPERMQPKKVAVYNLNWQLIKICNSFGEAEREFKIKEVSEILRGLRGHPRRYKLKSVSKEGVLVTPPLFVPIKPFRDQTYRMKPVSQIDANGDVVNTFPNVRVAAKYMGCSFKLIHNALKKKPRYPRAKGYFWKYTNPEHN